VSTNPSERVTFVTVSSARYFPGAVAMYNSLRLTGNQGDFVVLDWDLQPEQRALLGAVATVVPVSGVPHPMLAKPIVHSLDLRGTVVFVDADIIVTGSLDHVIRRTREGAICLFPDHASMRSKWFAEWEETFALSGPPRRQPYFNAGFVAFSVEHWPRLLERWWETCSRLTTDWPPWADAGDQDALNGILMAEVPPGAVAVLPEEEGPLLEPMNGVEVHDERTLSASLHGRPTLVLHYVLQPKAWDRRGWMRVRPDPYTRLLVRALWGDDVPLRIPPSSVPRWLRPDPTARLARTALGAAHSLAAGAVRLTPIALRRRLLELRHRLAS
jgi:hypothetical protein